VFANIDGLTVFQVSADDAHDLVPELGPELAEADLTDLDDHTCYARWWSGGERPAVFSLRVDPPPQLDGERMRAIARRSAARFGRPAAAVRAEIDAILRLRQERRPPETVGGLTTQVQWTAGEAETEADQETLPTMQVNPIAPTRTRRSHARSNARNQR
jgi:hypothetical protein